MRGPHRRAAHREQRKPQLGTSSSMPPDHLPSSATTTSPLAPGCAPRAGEVRPMIFVRRRAVREVASSSCLAVPAGGSNGRAEQDNGGALPLAHQRQQRRDPVAVLRGRDDCQRPPAAQVGPAWASRPASGVPARSALPVRFEDVPQLRPRLGDSMMGLRPAISRPTAAFSLAKVLVPPAMRPGITAYPGRLCSGSPPSHRWRPGPRRATGRRKARGRTQAP